MRVAFIVRAYPTVSETFIEDQIRGLRRKGVEVVVYSMYVGASEESTRPTGQPSVEARYLIGPVLPLGRAVGRALGRAAHAARRPVPMLRLAPLLLDHPRIVAEAVHALPMFGDRPAFDLVHAHYGPTGMLALALRRAKLLDAPLMTTFHGIDLSRYPMEHGPDCYRWLFAEGEAFTVNSTFAETRALALGAPRGRLEILPVGLDVDAVPFAVRSLPADGPVRLLSVGRLEGVKGFTYGLRAVRLLRDRGVDVRYTIVGGGRLESALRSEAAELGIAELVRFAGPLPFEEVVAEYGRHHLFLMPGIETEDRQAESQGRVLLEAQAAGVPIVASRVGGIPETLGAGAGVLVQPSDAGALAEAVATLIDEHPRWAAMGHRGRAHVEAGYGNEALLERLLRSYERLASQRGTRREEIAT